MQPPSETNGAENIRDTVKHDSRFHDIFTGSPDPIFVEDIDGNILDVNPAACRLHEMTYEELVGRNVRELVPPEQLATSADDFPKLFAGELDHIESLSWTKSGRAIPVEIRANRIRYDDKDALLLHVRDITERKNVDNVLRESEARYRLLMESAPDPVVMYDMTGNTTYINPMFEQTFGWTSAELLGKRIDFVPPDLFGQMADGIKLLFTEGRLVAQETQRLTKDGRRLDVQVSASVLRDKEGNPTGTFVITRDVTANKLIEAAHRESEERYRTLIESSPDATVMYNMAGLVTYVNPAFETTFGWSSAELMGKRVDFVPPEYVETTREALQRLFRERKVQGFESKRLTKVGRLLDVQMSASTFNDKEGNPAGSIVIIRDVTAFKEAERELHRARDAAESANRAKSAFLANMSHELRTPLNAIIGYSEMLEEEAKDSGYENFVPDLKKIQSAGSHLLDLINNILDLSKIEAGKMELYLEGFEVKQMIDDVKMTIQPLIAKNSNRLEITCAPEVGSMYADVTKVRQTLFNLLSNAAKFSEDGIIKLTAERRVEDDKVWMVFKVTDSGVGMSLDQMRQVFKEFTQADVSTTRKYGGTGLGLTISRRFCQMMGGDINVDSEEGKGSTFTVLLPVEVEDVDRDAKLRSAKSTQELRASLGELKKRDGDVILVIDDDADVQELLLRSLTKEGFVVEIASSGEEGLALAREVRPAAITLDVMMGDTDGWVVLTSLKNEPELQNIPVIMLTMVDDKNKGFALGASDYLTKPVDRKRLVSMLNKYRQNKGKTGKLSAGQILVVDDDMVTREMLRRTLERAGWTVEEAEHGRAALERMQANVPNLVLLDLMMPEMDGFQFIAELQANTDWRKVPIVVVTAKDLTLDDQSRLKGYVKQVIEKRAYTRDELLKEVRDLLVARIDEGVVT